MKISLGVSMPMETIFMAVGIQLDVGKP